jgi:hypothetical protein
MGFHDLSEPDMVMSIENRATVASLLKMSIIILILASGGSERGLQWIIMK